MRLTERIWLVGSGLQGSGLTNDFDCHVYLVDCGSSAVLIDSGAGIEPERIEAEITAAGFALDRISHLLLTHGHADHSGGVAHFQQRTGCAVVASPEVAGFMERRDTAAISLDLAKEAGIYPADYQWRTCPVAVTLADGQAIQVGDSVFTALATPGMPRDISALLRQASMGLCCSRATRYFMAVRFSSKQLRTARSGNTGRRSADWPIGNRHPAPRPQDLGDAERPNPYRPG